MRVLSSATGRHVGMDLSRKPILETIFHCMEEDPTIVIIGEGIV